MIIYHKIKNSVKRHSRLYKVIYQDFSKPLATKVFLCLAIGYAFMRFDLKANFVPVVGHLDDIILVPGLIYIGLKFLPEGIYKEHNDRIFRGN